MRSEPVPYCPVGLQAAKRPALRAKTPRTMLSAGDGTTRQLEKATRGRVGGVCATAGESAESAPRANTKAVEGRFMAGEETTVDPRGATTALGGGQWKSCEAGSSASSSSVIVKASARMAFTWITPSCISTTP